MSQKPIDILLPSRLKSATLYFLAHTTHAEAVDFDLQFLHRVRDDRWLLQHSDWATSPEASRYYSRVADASLALRKELVGHQFDLIAMAPSRRRDAEPYCAAVKELKPDVRDVTRSFHRLNGRRAGEPAHDFAVIADTAFAYAASLAAYRSVVLIDDVYSSGKTTAAMLFWLEERGFPSDGTVAMVAPLIASPTP